MVKNESEWSIFVIRNFFSRLMYGRYGSDQLNIFLFVIFWLLWLVDIFVRNLLASSILSTVSLVVLLIAFFRIMSRNYSRRRAENDAFLKVFGPLIHWFKRKRNQARDKDHVYFKCPTCSQVLRVPRGKGKISITCRNCGTVFQEKT